MKNQQNNTSALSAFLRTANGGDTLETNSLCCAAAGIIAPPSAPAEALIPHEKLRGAALSDATLTAPARPLAQPAEGYKDCTATQEYLIVSRSTSTNVLQNFANNILVLYHRLHVTHQSLTILLPEDSVVSHRILKNSTRVTDTLKRLQCRLKSLLANRLRYGEHQRLMNTLHSPKTNSGFSIAIEVSADCDKCFRSFFHNAFGQQNRLDFNTKLSIPGLSLHESMRTIGDQKRPNNGTYRSNCLNPSSSVICRPLSKQQHRHPADKKSPGWRKCNFQQNISSETDFLRKHLWLLAIIQFFIVNKSRDIVHGGVV